MKINERLLERLEKLERYEEKTKKKEKEKFKWTKTGCEKQHDFNEEVKEVYSEKLRSELRRHFQGEFPNKVEEIIKEGGAGRGAGAWPVPEVQELSGRLVSSVRWGFIDR